MVFMHGLVAAKWYFDRNWCIKVYWKSKGKGRKTEWRNSFCRKFKCPQSQLAYGNWKKYMSTFIYFL